MLACWSSQLKALAVNLARAKIVHQMVWVAVISNPCEIFFLLLIGVVWPSVTLVHPVKAVGRNEMPFCRDTRVAPRNSVLDMGPRSPQGKRIFYFGGWNLRQNLRCKLRTNLYTLWNGYCRHPIGTQQRSIQPHTTSPFPNNMFESNDAAQRQMTLALVMISSSSSSSAQGNTENWKSITQCQIEL